MRPTALKFGLLILAVGSVAWVIVRQRQTTDALRQEAARLREQNRAAARLQAGPEKSELRQLSEMARETARQEEAEALALRAELAGLQRLLSTPPASDGEMSPNIVVPSAPSATPRQWTNAGQATPAAAFETLFWSALNGDTGTLAATITFDPAGRKQVDELFARLPESMRTDGASPEKIFATLLAARIPQDLSAATVVQTAEDGSSAMLRMHLQRTSGQEKDAAFYFNRGPAGWQLIVPAAVVENYQQMLANAPK